LTGDVAARFAQGLGGHGGPLGLAVSGGGDSTALLHLAVQAGLCCRAVTVDHGLRDGSAAEAVAVARLCADLGVAHEVLPWLGWDRRGNLQDQARRARYRLIADWARRHGLTAVALGHNRDDLAETFVMRLARGAGVDGLAAMAARRQFMGVTWLRPLLRLGRGTLRDWLTGQGLAWVDDPSNANSRFQRVRVRRATATLATLGMTAETLASVAGHLAEVRQALEVQTIASAREIVNIEAGDVVISALSLQDLPPEIARRLLVQALVWVSSAEYGPRGPALMRAMATLRAGRAATLMGCRILPGKDKIRITREWQAVRDLRCSPNAVWDGRWRVLGPQTKGLEVRALGAAGLALCPDWRKMGLPRPSLLASPSIWRGEELVAAPLAGLGNGWHAQTPDGKDGFFLSILSH